MLDNPFDQLGLKKELVAHLHQQGKLDDYLKSYVRLNQLHIHPDRGGDTNLSSVVNSAYTSLQQHPEQREEWLRTMQNGHNEYKDMLEALVPEMERMQKENDQLRQEKAAAFATRAGSVDASVRPAPTSSSAPKVKTPPRVDPDIRTPPRTTATPPRTAPTPDTLIAGKYILMPQTSTYALGVDALRTLDKKTFTFKENILARVEAYESGDHRLFDTWLDSCTGIAYKKGTTKFKIINVCSELSGIAKEFNQFFLPTNYGKIDGVELDSDSRVFGKSAKYNSLLTKAEIVEHPAWLAVVDNDKVLLKNYTDIVFTAYAARHRATDKLMGFYVREKTATDELRALFVYDLFSYSYANGLNGLNLSGRFLAGR